ncbi:hypothetical protein RHIZO_03994 [Rhizobiaceae bacterium]|nr:hypothetical protein RHIZO_03994 [Rhizobiaceae bacterium]
MTHHDVFNGDADGLCALHQWRLAEPRESVLVTGLKREVNLVERVDAKRGDSVCVFDVSLATNRAAVVALLERGVSVRYFDHHFAGEPISHAAFEPHIDTSPGVCSGILVDRHLGGSRRVWAVVAAFGDSLPHAARELAASLQLAEGQLDALRNLGDALAYNAYGDCDEDVVIGPAATYRTLSRHADPFAFMRDEPVFARIRDARLDDLERARGVAPHAISPGGAVYTLPDAAWSRRVRGALANELAHGHPARAHAVLTPAPGGGFVASVRAPLDAPSGADRFCRSFATGGGRAAAAGINRLPADDVPAFVDRFRQAWP